MSDVRDPAPLPEGLGILAAEWHQTPLRVRLGVLTCSNVWTRSRRRLPHDSSNSQVGRCPQRRPRQSANDGGLGAERRKPGANPGHRGHPPGLLAPTAPIALFPDACPCGPRRLADLTRDHPHQVIALPVIQPEVMHWLLSQGRCLSCGKLGKSPALRTKAIAPVPGGRVSEGRWRGLLGRAAAQCKRSVAETSWLMHGDRQWLWVMANAAVAYLQSHTNRSKAAFAQRMGDWRGIVVRDGYGG